MDSADDTEDLGILITNINGERTESDIREFFSKYGKITYVKIIPDKFNDGANICYMKYDNPEPAKKASEELDRTEVLNNTVRVTLKKILTKYSYSDSSNRSNFNKRTKDSPVKESNVIRQPSQGFTAGRGRGAIKQDSRSPGGVTREVSIPDVDIPINSMIAVELIELVDTNNMLLRPLQQTEQSKTELDSVVNKYNNESRSLLRKLFNPKIGSFCLAKWHEDDKYYRARVLEVKTEGCIVAFIDEGNAGDLSRDIMEIPDDLSSYPAQFMNCQLNCQNSEELINFILEELAEKQLYVYMVPKGKESKPTVVNMYLADKEVTETFNNKNKKDIRRNPLSNISNLKTYRSGHEIKNFIVLESPKCPSDAFKLVISDSANPKPSMKPLSSLPLPHDIVLYKQTADFVHRAEVLQYDVIKARVNFSLRLIDENRTVDGVATDQIMQPTDDKALEPARIIKCQLKGCGQLTEKGTIRITDLDKLSTLYTIEFIPEVVKAPRSSAPSGDSSKKGYISHVEKANEFYINFVEIEDDLAQLEVKLISYSGSCVRDTQIGSMVVAPFEGTLYRAVIKDVLAGGSRLLVHFVDYGNNDEVASDSVLECSGALRNIPHLATKCKMPFSIKRDKMEIVKEMIMEYSDNMPLDIMVEGKDGNCLLAHLHLPDKQPLSDLIKKEGCIEESVRPVQLITPTKQNGHVYSPNKRIQQSSANYVPKKRNETTTDEEMKQRIFELEERIMKLERIVKA